MAFPISRRQVLTGSVALVVPLLPVAAAGHLASLPKATGRRIDVMPLPRDAFRGSA